MTTPTADARAFLDEWQRMLRETGRPPQWSSDGLTRECTRFMERKFEKVFKPGSEQARVLESFFFALRVTRDELTESRAKRDEVSAFIERNLPVLDAAGAAIMDLGSRRKAQQAGNEARRAVDDGALEDASRRHLAGEKWDAIAPDYSLSPSRLRELVRAKGLPTRGRR